MTRMLLLLGAIAGVFLTALPAQAQRVFVSGSGSDSNPCTFAAPCRSFQQAFNTVTAVTTSGGEIDVLDPAGYGPLTITHGISIQAHGFGGITQTGGLNYAITINAGTSDVVTLNGLLLDGDNSGGAGIDLNTAGSLQVLNCVIRHFASFGIFFNPSSSTNLLVSNTVTSDNGETGILIEPMNGAGTTPVTLKRITANNNSFGIAIAGGKAMIAKSVMSNNGVGLQSDSGVTWVASSTISGNGTGVNFAGGTVDSYGNNAIDGNSADISNGTLSSANTQ